MHTGMDVYYDKFVAAGGGHMGRATWGGAGLKEIRSLRVGAHGKGHSESPHNVTP